jgi:hypothetical protein
MKASPAPVEVYCCYADADEPLRADLEKHLSQLSHDGLITIWHKRKITAGTEWKIALDSDTKPYDAGQGWSIPVTENVAKSRESRSMLISHCQCGPSVSEYRKISG